MPVEVWMYKNPLVFLIVVASACAMPPPIAEAEGAKGGADTADAGVAADVPLVLDANLDVADVVDAPSPADVAPDASKKLPNGKTGWGTDGKGAGVQLVNTLSVAPLVDACDQNGDGKPDNHLLGMSSLIGNSFQAGIDKGNLVYLLDPDSFATDGTAFTYHVYVGGKSGSAECLPGKCDYSVFADNFAGDCMGKSLCASQIALKATAPGGNMQTEATKAEFLMQFKGGTAAVWVVNMTAKATVSGTKSWDGSANGTVCGVLWSDMTGTTNGDIDLDGDGKKESVSFALHYTTVPATVAPWAP